MKNLKAILAGLTFVMLFVLGANDVSAQSYGNMAGSAKAGSLPIAEHFEGGKESLLKAIQESLNYPPTAKRNRIQGECIIRVKMMEDGSFQTAKIVKNIGGGCGEEAQRVVKSLKFKAPGYIAEYNIPVRFKL